jgi:hypothetical protein
MGIEPIAGDYYANIQTVRDLHGALNVRDPVTGLSPQEAHMVSTNDPSFVPRETKDAFDQRPTPIEQVTGESFFSFIPDPLRNLLVDLGLSLWPLQKGISNRERLFRAVNVGTFAIPFGVMSKPALGLLKAMPALRAMATTRGGQVALFAASEGAIGAGLELLHGPDEEGRMHVVGSTVLSAALGGALGGVTGGAMRAARTNRGRLIAAKMKEFDELPNPNGPIFNESWSVLMPGPKALAPEVQARKLAEMSHSLKKAGFPHETARWGGREGLLTYGLPEDLAIDFSQTMGSKELLTNRGLFNLERGHVYPLSRVRSAVGASVTPANFPDALAYKSLDESKTILVGPGFDTRAPVLIGETLPRTTLGDKIDNMFPDWARKSWGKKTWNALRDLDMRPVASKWYRNMVRSFYEFEVLEGKKLGKSLKDLPSWESVAKSAELFKSRSASIVNSAVRRGVPERMYLDDAGRVAITRQTRPLLDILGDLTNPSEFPEFEKFGFARWMIQTIEDYGTDALQKIGDAPIGTLDEARAIVDSAPKHFENILQEVTDWYNRFTEISLVDSGLIPRDQLDTMMVRPDGSARIVVPLRQTLESVERKGTRDVDDFLALYDPTKMLKKKGLENPEYDSWIGSIIEQSAQNGRMADEQRLRDKLVNLVRQSVPSFVHPRLLPDVLSPAQKQAQEEAMEAFEYLGIRPVMAPTEDGRFINQLVPNKEGELVSEWWEVTNEGLWDGLKSIGPTHFKNWSETTQKMFSALTLPAKVLRASVTLTFEFLAKNPVRDVAFAWTTAGLNPLAPVKGLGSVLRQDNFYEAWELTGGARSALVSLDRDGIKNLIIDAYAAGDRKTHLKNVVATPRGWLDALQGFSEAMENASRLGMFRQTLAKSLKNGSRGIDLEAALWDAALASKRGSVNFGVGGASQTATAIRGMTSFWNAGVQGLDTLARATYNDPLGVAARGSLLTAISTGLYLANRKDDEYLYGISDWEKMLFWHAKVPDWAPEFLQLEDEWLRFPKPFEAGIIFSSLPEAFLQSLDKDNPGVLDDMAFDMIDAIGGTLLPMPTAVQPFLDIKANEVAHSGAPILTSEMEGLDPDEHTTGRASLLAISMARFLNQGAELSSDKISPLQIEHIMSSYTGGLGRMIYSEAPEMLIDAWRGVIQGRQPDARRNYQAGVRNTPIARAFVSTFPYNSQTVKRFYELGEEARILAETALYLEENLKLEDTVEYYRQHLEMMQLTPLVETQVKQLLDLREQRDAIIAAPLPLEQKKSAIMRLSRMMHQVSVPMAKILEARGIY